MFKYEIENVHSKIIILERQVWQDIEYIGLMRTLIFEMYLKEYDGIQSDGMHTELGMKYWKKVLEQAGNVGYAIKVIKNNKEYDFNIDKFDLYYKLPNCTFLILRNN